MLVEGGFTRFLAVYKDKELDRIGTVRSSRHYFLDYALENDAIYVHFGWSPQAQSDIKSLNVDNINFMTYEGYIRDTSLGLAFEHTAFTTTDGIMEGAKYYNYRTTSTSKPVLNYSVEDVNLSELDSIVANNITLAFSKNHTTGYVYDAKSKTYKRYQCADNAERRFDDLQRSASGFLRRVFKLGIEFGQIELCKIDRLCLLHDFDLDTVNEQFV